MDRRLVSHQSDILIQTKLHNRPLFVYILIEHKFYPYRWTMMQLLRYMVPVCPLMNG